MGFLTFAWWSCRVAVLVTVIGFYWHYALSDKPEGNHCDKPLFIYIITEGTLCLLHMMLRSTGLVVGINDDPDSTVQFMILYPVILHVVEVVLAIDVAMKLLTLSEKAANDDVACDLPLTSSYVYFSALCACGAFLAGGVLCPLMFDTRFKGHGSDLRTIHVDPNASPHGAGRFMKDVYSFFLIYRTGVTAVMFVTFLASRNSDGHQLVIESNCIAALEVWIFLEAGLYLVTYLCTLTYAVRALLWPVFAKPISTHEKWMWVFALMNVLSGFLGTKLVYDTDTDTCPQSATYYVAYATVICFSTWLICTLFAASCWRPWFVTRREKAKAGQEMARTGGGARNEFQQVY